VERILQGALQFFSGTPSRKPDDCDRRTVKAQTACPAAAMDLLGQIFPVLRVPLKVHRRPQYRQFIRRQLL
jgi:hypothetical protein